MTSAAYQNLLASFLDEAKAARLAGNTEAVLAWELAAARLTQAEADSLQTSDDSAPAATELEPPSLGSPVGTSVATWQCELEQPGHGFHMVRSQGVTFHFHQQILEQGQPVPAPRRELRVEVVTLFLEVRDPADFAKIRHELKLHPAEIGIVIHPCMMSSLPPSGESSSSADSQPDQLAKIQLAARQCERMARFFLDSSIAGDAKAAGYRHAVHIFRTIGGLDIPEPTALRAAGELPGTVPAADLFSHTL